MWRTTADWSMYVRVYGIHSMKYDWKRWDITINHHTRCLTRPNYTRPRLLTPTDDRPQNMLKPQPKPRSMPKHLHQHQHPKPAFQEVKSLVKSINSHDDGWTPFIPVHTTTWPPNSTKMEHSISRRISIPARNPFWTFHNLLSWLLLHRGWGDGTCQEKFGRLRASLDRFGWGSDLDGVDECWMTTLFIRSALILREIQSVAEGKKNDQTW